jgi:osmotically-inducible protein OsmY
MYLQDESFEWVAPGNNPERGTRCHAVAGGTRTLANDAPGEGATTVASSRERRSDGSAWFGWASAARPTDGEIRGILVDQLREDPFTRREAIHVTVADGVATMTGSVTSSIARRAADDDAWATPGVRDVENHLRVALRTTHDGPRAA